MLIRTLRRIQGGLAVSAPLAVAVAVTWRVVSTGIAARPTVAGAFLLAVVATLAVCLHKRANGRETVWLNARIAQDPPGEENESVFMFSADVALVLGVISFVLVAFWHAAG